MNPLSSDVSHYDATSKVFNEKSGRFRLEREWAETEFRRVVAAKLKTKKETDGCSPIIRSLGIGSGEGKIELSLLQQISDNNCPRLNHVVVEPSHGCIELYKSAVNAASTPMPGIDFEWHEKTLTQFQRYHDVKSQAFDFISAVHSLYYVEDVVETVKFLYDSLDIEGILMISLTEGYSDRRSLSEIPELRSQYIQDNLVYISDIKKVLAEIGAEYECLSRSIPVDITEVFDDTSKDGDLLLDFITHVIHFRKTVRPDLVGRVLAFLRDLAAETASAKHGIMTNQENENKRDQIVISEDWEVLLICKTCKEI